MADTRVGDYVRPMLWQSVSEKQIFILSFLTDVLGSGPSVVATSFVPDVDHFRGSFGAKHTIPLYRDAAAAHPNITAGLLERLAAEFGQPVTPEDLLGYVYALLGATTYAERFAAELATPGPHVPLTRDGELFFRVVAAGRKLVGIQTYGERLGQAHRGKAQNKKVVSTTPDGYPQNLRAVSHDAAKQELHVGDGVFGSVSEAVWTFSVSGLQVVRSWLGYRMAERSGKKSSPLDDIRPESWPLEYTTELLDLLWLVEGTLEVQPQLAALLDEVLNGELWQADELPQPSAVERDAPKLERKGGIQEALF